jgi:hypothetical protein
VLASAHRRDRYDPDGLEKSGLLVAHKIGGGEKRAHQSFAPLLFVTDGRCCVATCGLDNLRSQAKIKSSLHCSNSARAVPSLSGVSIAQHQGAKCE